MGDFTSVLTPVLQLGAGFYKDSVSAKQQKEQNRLEESQRQASNAFQKEQMRVVSEQAEINRRAALKRAVAKQRAQFGGSGIGSGDGSSEAVLLGLFDESEEERRQREQMEGIKASALDMSAGAQRQLNLLQQAQMMESRNLNAITGALKSKWREG